MRKKPSRKLALSRESVLTLTPSSGIAPAGTASQPSICVGCTSEYTWYCPTHSACSLCPICGVD